MTSSPIYDQSCFYLVTLNNFNLILSLAAADNVIFVFMSVYNNYYLFYHIDISTTGAHRTSPVEVHK